MVRAGSASCRNLVMSVNSVRREDNVIAVMAVVTAFEPDRVPSQIQGNYEQVSSALIHMVTTGEFPFREHAYGRSPWHA